MAMHPMAMHRTAVLIRSVLIRSTDSQCVLIRSTQTEEMAGFSEEIVSNQKMVISSTLLIR